MFVAKAMGLSVTAHWWAESAPDTETLCNDKMDKSSSSNAFVKLNVTLDA